MFIRLGLLAFFISALAGCGGGSDGAAGPAGAAGVAGVAGAAGAAGAGAGKPANTYFTMAFTDNGGGSHRGDNLLYMKFLDEGVSASGVATADIVAAPKVAAGAITMDGDISDWPAANLSTIKAINQSGTGLAATTVKVGAAYDDQYVYMIAQWDDATKDNHKGQWVYNAASSVWALSSDNEDRLFVGFPIKDTEGNYKDGGKGCMASCHLVMNGTPAPGEGSMMAMNTTGDKLDMWHWQATRSAPARIAQDKYWIKEGWSATGGPENGRIADAGMSAYIPNQLGGSEYGSSGLTLGTAPMYVPFNGPFIAGTTGTTTRVASNDRVLWANDAISYAEWLLTHTPAAGDLVPGYVTRLPNGSFADVYAEAKHDGTKWTVEMRRLRNTGDGDDHQFVAATVAAPDAAAPSATSTTITLTPNATTGAALYTSKSCVGCHGAAGTNVAGHSIAKKGAGHVLAAGISYTTDGQVRTMPAIALTPQEAADISAHLGTL